VPAASSGQATVATKAFTLAWQRQTKPYNKGLSLTSGGRLAVLSSRQLSVLAVATGKTIAKTQVCFTFAGAMATVPDNRVAVVCEDAVFLYGLPSLGYLAKKSLPGQARVAAFSDTRLAVGFESGPVRVYDTSDFRLVATVASDERVTSLALAPGGGSLAVGLEHGEMVVHALPTGKAKRLSVKRGFAVRTLAFDAKQRLLIAAAGPITTLWSVAPEQKAAFMSPRVLRLVRNVTAAAWVSARELAVVGGDGLLLLDAVTGSARSMGGGWVGGQSPPTSVASRAKVLCSATRDGRLACFSRGKLPATRQLPALAEPGGRGTIKMAGRVVGLQGTRLRIKAHPRASLPKVGTKVTVLRFREQEVRGLVTARWHDVGKGTVLLVDKDVVHVRFHKTLDPQLKSAQKLIYDTPVKLAYKR